MNTQANAERAEWLPAHGTWEEAVLSWYEQIAQASRHQVFESVSDDTSDSPMNGEPPLLRPAA